jgi:hypothetical protein
MAKTVENGCTEAEAMNALSMAQAMMDAYDVSSDDIEEAKKESATRAEMKDMRDPHHIRNNLAVRVSKFTNTMVWTHNKKKFNFVGLPSDIDFAMWLLEHLTLFVQKELKNYLWANGYQSLEASSKRRVINGFILGCCSRINARLKELTEQGEMKRNENANALIVVKNDLIDKKMQELNLNLRMPRSRRSRIEPNGYAAGQAAGNNASFGRPVGQGGQLRIGK